MDLRLKACEVPLRRLLWAVALSLSVSTLTYGFDDQTTHPQMTEKAARASNLNATLTNELDITDGINAMLTGSSGKSQRVFEWLRAGSILEDSPTCRASNHFHNPLRPFTASGVTDLPFWIQAYCGLGPYGRITSNVTWGTRFTTPTGKGPDTGNRMDWDAARTAYLDALTKPDPGDREAALAQTFQALGQVMHLVQDVAVPAHVRNDFRSHLQYFAPQLNEPPTRWFSNGFEQFVRLQPGLVGTAGALPIAFTDRLVTRFWDTDQYYGGNPAADMDQGLAEYTNANFASQNTIFTESAAQGDPYAFPYPRRTSTDLADVLAGRKPGEQVVAEDGTEDSVLYVSKIADGEQIGHFLRAGSFTRLFSDSSPLRPILPSSLLPLTLEMDEVVHRDYAARLLPRAVGYSTGILDYFFRGRLDFEIKLDEADPTDPTRLGLVIRNRV